jgi:hypothetical protein
MERALMLDLLGYSRGGQVNHLPDDIIFTIKAFLFFDVRSNAYQQHLVQNEIKKDKLFALDNMMSYINRSMVRYLTGKYGVDYTPNIIDSKCCIVCGEFIPLWHPILEKINCSCKVMSNQDIDELEYRRQCSNLWNEEEYFDEKINTQIIEDEEYQMEDDSYSDRKLNWDECGFDDDYY